MKCCQPMLCVVGLCLFVLLSPYRLAYAIDTAEEYEIKAVYFFNLGSFATWPASVLAKTADPVNLCILGEDPFGNTLDFIVKKNKTIQKHPAVIKRINDIEQAGSCHLLFVGDSMKSQLNIIFSWLESRPILSISDIKEFVVKGGMIEFYRRDNKVRLQLDPATIDEAGLKVNAQLMKIARIVSGQGGMQ